MNKIYRMLEYNLEIGIWEITLDGISCNLKNHNHSFIENEWIMSTESLPDGIKIWGWPVHFARKTWTTEKEIEDLMKALAVKRQSLGHSINRER